MSKFEGWDAPQSNYSKLPHSFWEIDDLTPHESMVLLYILRHTWGYQQYGMHKKITVDEFQNGRKTKDGVRMDKGCRVSRGKISEALNTLEEKGYISVEVDASDPARIKKSYMLKMANADNATETQEQSSVHVMNPEFTERTQRSFAGNRTEKETSRKKLKKEEKSPAPAHEEDFLAKRAILDGLGLIGNGSDIELFKADAEDYGVELFEQAAETFKERRKDKGRFLGYKYFSGVLRGKAAEAKQAEAINGQPANVVPYHKPAQVDDAPEMTDAERDAFIAEMRKARAEIQEKSA